MFVIPDVILLPFNRSFFFNDTAPTEIYTLSLHDALPITSRYSAGLLWSCSETSPTLRMAVNGVRSEEHTSELQSLAHFVCRLLLEKKKLTRVGLDASQKRSFRGWRKVLAFGAVFSQLK